MKGERDRNFENSSSSGRMSTMSNGKFEVEKFDRTSNLAYGNVKSWMF